MAMGRYGAAFVAGAVIGGVAGVTATLWRAPQAGRVTRSQLGEQLLAHAGPASGLLVAAGDGLNKASVRLVQGLTIATRFVEELISPTPTDNLGRPIAPVPPVGPVPPVDVADPTAVAPENTAVTYPAPPAGSSAASSYRPAAMNITPFPTHRTVR